VDAGVGVVPLTPVMCWMAERAGAGVLAGRFSQWVTAVVPGGLAEGGLRAAFQVVLDQHDMLRARLEPAGGDGWQLRVPAAGAVAAGAVVSRWDAAGVDEGGLGAAAAEQARRAAGRLDPRAGVMVQAVWLDAGPGRAGRLAVAAHHLVVDGVSWRIILPDLAAAYAAVAAGRPAVLDRPGISFRGWARQLAGRAREPGMAAEVAVWQQVAGQDGPLLGARPLDRRRDTAAVTRRVVAAAGPQVTAALLTTVSQAFHAGPADVLLAALAAAVADWRARRGLGGGPVLVDVEGHGRQAGAGEADLSRTVGWFTSIYPVRLDPGPADLAGVRAGTAAAGRLLKLVKEQLRAVPGDGLGYGLLRYLNPGTGPALAALPAAQIGFNYLGRFTAPGAGDGGGGPGGGGAAEWRPAADQGLGGTADPGMPVMHLLEAAGVVRDLPAGPELTLSLVWPGQVLTEAAVQDLLHSWADMLAGLAAHAASPGAGGYTPSDFPLADVTQDEIEEFEAMAAKMERGTPT